MKKTGYRAEFAGAVEAAASTGGQIMPPIMGAAAFLMTEYVNEPYGQIAVRAILPAVLYFLGIFIAVHLEAKKFGLRGIPRSELPKFSQLIRKIYLLAPLVILIYLVTSNSNTIQVSASIAIIVAVVASLFDKDNRITPKRFFEALAAGARGTITVAVACGIAGVIAGCITVTGLGSKLISGVIALSGGNVMIGLVLVWKIRPDEIYRAVFDIDASTMGGTDLAVSASARMKVLENFVSVQSDAALRQVAGCYSYDNNGVADDELTLRSNSEQINDQLEHTLNERLAMAGIEVVEARINYLAYAPEIAAVMLRRQQADAIISAREKIVEGAVSMVHMALDRLGNEHIVELDEERKAAMVSNLLVVLCADEAAQPVVNAGTLHH